jgi:AcrR family transcriptional regulator
MRVADRRTIMASPDVGQTQWQAARRGETSPRELIVDTALSLWQQYGSFQAVTMRALARHVGVSPTALYQYFDSKETLQRTVRAKATQGLRGCLEAALRSAEDPRAAAVAWVECYASSSHGDPWSWATVLDLEGGGPHDREETAELVGIEPLQRVLDRAVSNGGARSHVDRRLAAWLVWSGAHGLLLLRRSVQSERECQDPLLLRQLANGVVNGVLRAPEDN